ncbi:MAG: hypothetical protein EOM69_11590, partial [Clostridia bacterium]|nr:hypothetical protein [Clostridia bacterium]
MQSAPVRERSLYVDVLRVIACFLVIVNHTNSRVFQHSDPSQAIWYLSMGYYYLAKTAVPLFVMISGICLLGKDDSPRRALGRFLRMLAVTVLFSYLYYCYHHDWSFVYATSPRAFLESLWDRPATDAFWYLYMYLGLLLCMPLMQRLVKALSKGWLGYFLLVSLGVLGAWPLAQHYFPSLKAPMFFDLPMFGLFLGLLAAGHYLRVYVKTTRRGVLIASLLLPASLVA